MFLEDSMTANEDLLTSLAGHTRKEDTFNAFVGFVTETKLSLSE